MFKQYDVVMTNRSLTGEWGTLRSGSKGTIVEVYRTGQKVGYDVEFVTASGRTKAIVVLSAKDILPAVQVRSPKTPRLAKAQVTAASAKKVSASKAKDKSALGSKSISAKAKPAKRK